MGLLVLVCALIETISDTVKGRESSYCEYDYDNYFNLCTMLEEQKKKKTIKGENYETGTKNITFTGH